MIPTTPRQRSVRRGFTLLEILVVIGIVAILVAITTMVGSAVVNTGKRQATVGVLQTLDEALVAYIERQGDNPPALVEVPQTAFTQNFPEQGFDSLYFPAIDGRGAETRSEDLTMVNSVAYFIQSVKPVPETQTLIDTINERFRRNYSPDEEVQPFLLTVFDAWDNPIRYVHPKFDGIVERTRRSLTEAGEPVNIVNPNKPFFVAGALPEDFTTRVRMKFVRRNRLLPQDYGQDEFPGGLNPQALSDFDLLPDSDGGLTIGNRPYFYSAGPDGNPATIEDNIYLQTPQFVDPGVID